MQPTICINVCFMFGCNDCNNVFDTIRHDAIVSRIDSLGTEVSYLSFQELKIYVIQPCVLLPDIEQ